MKSERISKLHKLLLTSRRNIMMEWQVLFMLWASRIMKCVFICARVCLSVCFEGRIAAVPVNGVLVSLERVVDRRSHRGCHGIGVRSVRVLVCVKWRRVVQVHRLHGPRAAVRVPVHGARDPDAVHAVVGQVFVLHTTHTLSDWVMCAQCFTS